MNVVHRDVTTADLPRLAALYVAYDTVELGAPEMELDDLETMLTLTGAEHLGVEVDGVLLGFADIDGGGEVETAVDPSYAEAAVLQRQLVDWAVARGRARGCARLEHWAGPGPGGAGLVLEAAGFVHARTMWQLRRDLTGLTAPTWPDGVAVRPFTEDRDAVLVWELMTQAFAGRFGSHLRPLESWRERTLRPGVDVVCAAAGDRVVGAAVTSERGGGGHVHQLAVAPDWQGRGVAKALLHEAFRRDAGAGRASTSLVVDGENDTARRLYERVGMAVEREYRRWELDL